VPSVNTVLGPIPVEKLGRTRMHEHLFISYPGSEWDFLNPFDKEATLKEVVGLMNTLKARGVSTVVEATPITLGRNHEFLVAVAEASGMNIIASTGFYTRRGGLPDYFASMDVDGLAEMMERELTQGMMGSTVKAGVIKVASGVDKIVRSEERVLRAAARVYKATGLPIITHTDVGTLGGQQLDIFQSEGADLSRIVIGHTCCSSDIKNYLTILKRGAYAGFDRIGWELFQSEEVRVVAVAGLIGAGYANRMTLSQDSIAGWEGNPRFMPPAEEVRRVTYLEDVFIPRLLKGGISQKTVDQIFIDNPRHIFGG